MAEVLVIGAGVNGLVAATYLARSGAKVTVLEAGAEPGGVCANRIAVGPYSVAAGPHVLTALDPRVVKALNLTRLGLRFAVRDLPLVALRDGAALTISRDVHETRRSLAAVSEKDAAGYAAFRRAHFAFARAMRRVWWEDGILADEAARTRLRALQVTTAAAFLESAFESGDVRAAFAFDALAVNPQAAGSALVLAWMAAQEMCGLQGARAVAVGGPDALIAALVEAAEAAGVEIRCDAEVVRLELDGEAVHGAVLASGETVLGRTILSGLSRKKTLLDWLPPGAAGFAAAKKIVSTPGSGEAKIVLALKSCPAAFARPARTVIGDTLENAVQAHGEARAGKIPSDLFLEAVALEPATPPPEGPHEMLLSVMVRPLPAHLDEGWQAASAKLIPAVVRLLDHHAPGLAAAVSGIGFVPPAARDSLCLADLAQPWKRRIETPVRGLFLCGAAAEPVPCISGRGGRIAAAIAAGHLAEVDA